MSARLVRQHGRVVVLADVARVVRARTSRTLFVELWGDLTAAAGVLRELLGPTTLAYPMLPGWSLQWSDPPKGLRVAAVADALAAAGYHVAPADHSAWDEWNASLALARALCEGLCERHGIAIPEVAP